MILDRCDVAVNRDCEIMTSPLNFHSFYCNSSPVHEPACFSENPQPWSPNSDSGTSWNSVASPTQTSSNPNNISGESCVGSARHTRYLGVRVKNPVKELILQKRCSHASLSPRNDNKQVFENFETRDHCPALTAALLGVKRAANHLAPDPVCPKRPAPLYSSLQHSPCSLAGGGSTMKGEGPDCETRLEIDDIIQQIRHCAPVSLTTVQVQGSLSQTAPPWPDLPPKVTNCTLPQPPQPLPPVGGVSFFQWQVEQEDERLAGLDPNQLAVRDEDGDTFLHVAVAQGRRALSYVLARKMASLGLLDLKEHNGQTALQVSMAANQHLIVQDLLSMGAQINTMDRWGRSPLHVCAEKGHAQTLQAVHKTLQSTIHQLNMEAVNYEGLTALHTAVLSHNAVLQELAVAPPHSAQTQALLQRRKALGECVSTLLLMGASYRTKDHKSGRTALHMAAEEANVELLRLFLDQPDSLAAVNAKAYSGNTALHLVSALQGRVTQVDAVKLLMRRGADPSIKNLENEQPAQLVPEGPAGDQVRRILKGRGGPARSSLF
ncbi:NF-kappa-B inhibitor zeta-like [Anguilla anguilla]|uniref:NF-kappa-B inhibitor zeta-like n=1 Tax=Anguilla anguilla TaxID=7936 RepID=UPI0015A9228B|nr:NF-kappa-B inhibitor zeta-like [Anguilla anguilla]